MGVCKCKKRTDLWCYKMVMPVCFDCIVEIEHQLSCVAPYIDWLNNPHDQDLVCPLSQKLIVYISNSIRFLNLQVFQLDAILEYCSTHFSPNTAAAGFTIPHTDIPMLPPIGDQSKLAIQIREKLRGSPAIARIIETQRELVNSQSNIQEEISSVVRKIPRSTTDDNDVIIQLNNGTREGHDTSSLSKGKRHTLIKRLKKYFRRIKPRSFIIGTILLLIILYILFYILTTTLNLVEYEIFSIGSSISNAVDPPLVLNENIHEIQQLDNDQGKL